MSYTLYGYEGNPRTRVAQVVAQFEGLNVKLSEVNNQKKINVEPYLQKFPQTQGKIPALEGPNVAISETLAVASYLASVQSKANLLGRSKEENAEVLQWSSLVNSELHGLAGQWVLPLLPEPVLPYNKPLVTQSEQKYLAYLEVLEKFLLTRTFLVGQRVSLADIFLASNLLRPFATVLDPAFRKSHPNLTRYFLTVANQPQFTAVTGKAPVLSEKKLEYTPPKKEPKQAAAAAAPKAEKKAAAKKPAADDDDEPAAPAEPKAKHPCELLGPAKSFPLDEWKRQYSNLEFGKAMTWLSEHLDESEYTFWRVSYKYDDELTQVFMSANLIGGFHSRLEASRKYLFGSAGVYGKANASKIQGAYMIRGQDWKGVFDVAPDWESYNFEKLDFKKDQDYIRGCWNWDNAYEGLEYADGKVFK